MKQNSHSDLQGQYFVFPSSTCTNCMVVFSWCHDTPGFTLRVHGEGTGPSVKSPGKLLMQCHGEASWWSFMVKHCFITALAYHTASQASRECHLYTVPIILSYLLCSPTFKVMRESDKNKPLDTSGTLRQVIVSVKCTSIIHSWSDACTSPHSYTHPPFKHALIQLAVILSLQSWLDSRPVYRHPSSWLHSCNAVFVQ